MNRSQLSTPTPWHGNQLITASNWQHEFTGADLEEIDSALAGAQAVRAPKDFAHHALGVAALCEAVAVPAMGAGDVVDIRQVHAKPDRGRFLTRVEMHEPGDAARGKFLMHALLELADDAHVPIGL